MKTRGLIAGAFALALGLSASAESWFDAKINTYTEWPIAAEGVAEGGSWSNTEGATLNTESPAKLVVDAEDDAALTFTATDSKAIGDGVTINSTVTFNAFDSLPTVPEDAKAALIAVKDGDNNYDIYGLAYSLTKAANDWVEVLADQSNITDVPVSINLLWNGKQTEVTYTINGASTADLTVYTAGNATISGAAFSGCGEVAALAATYVVPMCTLTQGNLGEHDDYLNITSVQNAEDGTEYWNAGDGNAKIPVGVDVKIYFAIDPNYAKVITGNNWIEKSISSKTPIEIVAADVVGLTIQNAKAAIGSTYYLTFDAANAAAQSTDTITLLADVVIGAGEYQVNAATIVPGAYTITLTDAQSAFLYADGDVLGQAGSIVIAQALTEAGKILKYETDRYVVGVEGTVFTIVKGKNVESIEISDNQQGVYPSDPSEITVETTEVGELSFTVTAADGIQNPVYSVTKDGDEVQGSWNGNVFTTEDFDENGGTFTFTVEPGQTGVIFTLTATGIEGTPTYKIGAAEPVGFTAGGGNTWTATVEPNAVFTVGFAIPSTVKMPVVTWTTALSREGNVITMGGEAGAATLAITDASAADPNDPTAQAAAAAAIADSVTEAAQGMDLAQTKAAVAAQVAVLTEGGALPSAIAGWIETKGFTGAQVATAKAIDVSYDFGTDLFQTEAKAEVTAFAADAKVANTYAFEVQLKDGATPVAATQAAQAAVEKIVQASSDVADFTTVGKQLAPTITDVAVSEGKLTFKVALPTGAAKAFMRIAK